MRRSFHRLGVVAALILIVGMVASPAGSAQVPLEGDRPVRSVTVSGIGTAESVPESAVLRLGVQTQADTASEAFGQTSEQMQAVVDALLDMGLETADIQTQRIRLQPIQERTEPPGPLAPQPEVGQVIGFLAANIVEVRVRDVDQTADVLDAALEAGANVVESIRFGFDDPTALMMQAREEAFADARSKAEQLADLSNAQLGEVLTINDFSRMPLVLQDRAAVGLGAEIPIEPGMETVQVDLQVTWRLESPEVTPPVDEENAIEVEDQALGPDDTVVIAMVVMDQPGWVVIHADDDGTPGPVIGFASVEAGTTTDVTVEIDPDEATDTLHAMLHVDAGEEGVFEFPGPDVPATDAEGNVVMEAFELES